MAACTNGNESKWAYNYSKSETQCGDRRGCTGRSDMAYVISLHKQGRASLPSPPPSPCSGRPSIRLHTRILYLLYAQPYRATPQCISDVPAVYCDTPTWAINALAIAVSYIYSY